MHVFAGGPSGVVGLAVVMVLLIPLAAVVGAMLVAVVKAIKGSPGRQGAELDAEETRLIQEIHEGLQRMEERVEALETLLVNRDGDRDGDRDRDGTRGRDEGKRGEA